MDAIQPFLDYFAANPGWALVIVFLIAFGEALLIIGLFVPSTVALLGAGALVGLGKLGFWEVFFCTASGAILGDQISYWAGRLYGQQLKSMWPLRLYPPLVARGEDFMRSHGGKSIALGRFVPGIKAVVPGIAGMLGMGQARFAAVNISSGLVWALAHVVPGILLGQGLALAGELSGHLAIVLLALLAVVGVGGWLIRLVVGWLWPGVQGLQSRIYQWSLKRPEKRWRRLGRALAPHNPRSRSLIVFAILGAFALAGAMQLMSGVLAGGALANSDLSIFKLMQHLRNAPGDELMIMATMMGDTMSIIALIAGLVIALCAMRAWRTAGALVAAAVLALLFETVMKNLVDRVRPIEMQGVAEGFSFPSGHAMMAMTAFGLLAVIASTKMSRWAKAIVYALAAAAALAIGFSRIYLGAHWLSDVAAGLLFGALFTAGFGIYVQAFPPRRSAPIAAAFAAIIIWLAAGASHITQDYAKTAEAYAPRMPAIVLALDQWTGGQWASLPARRIDIAGKEAEPFIAQWAGGTDALAAALAAEGWQATAPWAWSASIGYLNPSAALKDLLPRPALHEGLKAGATFIKPIPGDGTARLVVRIWRTDYLVDARPVHLVSITRDKLSRRFSLYAIPSVTPADGDEAAAVAALLRKAGQAVEARGGGALLLLGSG